MSMPAASTKTIKFTTSLINEYTPLRWRAMLIEVSLLPKPDLVDRINCGAHEGTTLKGSRHSVLVTQGWLPRFTEFGACSAEVASEAVFHGLRPIGTACEGDMLRTTVGVNTHKGSIFSLELLCAAVGRLLQLNQPVTPTTVCSTAISFCRGLTGRGLCTNNSQLTAGQWLYQQSDFTGARGEVEVGYPLVINHALPHYPTPLDQGLDPELVLLDTLLLLMTTSGDTSAILCGGEGDPRWLQHEA